MSSYRHARGLLLGAAALALAACASIDAKTTEYVGAPHAAPTQASNVEILRTEPTKPHVRLGEIVVSASTEPAPSATEIEQKLRVEAAKIGGDAVVVVYDQIQPVAAYVSGPLWNRDIEAVDGRKLQGVVIRYTR
ncbi:hypothetical protein LOY24_18930 [Pseudomonas putida]|jgi:starvation-inducible outer membrane lipoprotein|uniref:hypothetical protein n=1 Tax=Pseudomonas putida TaxID=303 RepID=UPI00215E7639|nr:hypothetical protein [Pseudomonas putida]UVL76795.1 hypothetical protein LOY24_18930 [Pseudomonas putida]